LVRAPLALIYPEEEVPMYVAESKRLTSAGAKKMAATAIEHAREAGVAITVAVADAGGHLILLERMDGGGLPTGPPARGRGGGRLPGDRGRRMRRRRRRRRRRLGVRRARGTRGGRIDRGERRVNVACIGMGWWSDGLADAGQRSQKLKIAACYSRSAEKREKFASKYGCRAAPAYEAPPE